MPLSRLSAETLGVPRLHALYADLAKNESFVRETLSAMRQLDADIAWRAIWLLNRFAKEHGLGESVIATICEEASGFAEWRARLLLCQLLSKTGCPPATRESAFPFLAACAADRHAITRAWAFTALSRFADDPEFRSEIQRILIKAGTEKSKAIQARLRQLKPPARTTRA